jgi:phytoene desaturase
MTEPLTGETVTVIGGGFGGLSAAAHLADRGADVTLLEQHEHLGGVAGRIETDGFRFDTGPTWYLMPDAFERFFGQFGREPAEFYDLERLEPHYRVFWKDGDRADLDGDRERLRALFDSYEAGAGEALDDYLATARESYEVGMERFVYTDRSRLRELLAPEVLRSARGLTLLGSMADHAASYFDHPKLRQLVQYTLVFLGGAPHNTPALYSLLAHVDFNLGVHYPDGGMASVVDGVAELAREQGADLRTGTAVTGLDPLPDGVAVETADGGRAADRVVATAPAAYVERELLPPTVSDRGESYWASRTYGPAAFLLYLGVEGDVAPLAHHTLVLPENWDPHFEAIFEEPRWPDDPAYYLCVPSVTDDGVAPDGHHAVVVLVPVAPGLSDDETTRERYRETVLADVADYTGVDLRDRIVLERSACVSEFAERFGAPGGTALGMAHTLRQTGPLRPGHRADGVDRLYYAGSDTRPGIGVPMTLVSGEHAAAAVVEDAAAADRSRLPTLR